MAGRSEVLEAKPPRFIKVIVDEILREGKLLFPKRFIRKYWKDVPDGVILNDPSGAEWRIGLTMSDGKVWLEKGWKEFAEHYSLAYGCYILFEYEGNCNFDVIIFDKGATEMEYPQGNRQKEQPGQEAKATQCVRKKLKNSKQNATSA